MVGRWVATEESLERASDALGQITIQPAIILHRDGVFEASAMPLLSDAQVKSITGSGHWKLMPEGRQLLLDFDFVEGQAGGRIDVLDIRGSARAPVIHVFLGDPDLFQPVVFAQVHR